MQGSEMVVLTFRVERCETWMLGQRSEILASLRILANEP